MKDRPKAQEAISRVLVITERYDFTGNLHLIDRNRRETDILNDQKPFLHLTEVEIKIREKNRIIEVPFVAVNKTGVICMIPLEGHPEREKLVLA